MDAQVINSLVSVFVGAFIAIISNFFIQKHKIKNERLDIAMLEARTLCFDFITKLNELQNCIEDNEFDEYDYQHIEKIYKGFYGLMHRMELICPGEIFRQSSSIIIYIMSNYISSEKLTEFATYIGQEVINGTRSSDELVAEAISYLREKDLSCEPYHMLKEHMNNFVATRHIAATLPIVIDMIKNDLTGIQMLAMSPKIGTATEELKKCISNYFANYLARETRPFIGKSQAQEAAPPAGGD